MYKTFKTRFLDNLPFIIVNEYNPLVTVIKKIIKKKNIISFINPHSFIVSKQNKIFQRSLKISKNFVDGIGIYLLFKFFLKKNIYRVTGYIFTNSLLKILNNHKVFFLGTTLDILIKLKKNVRLLNPSIKIKYYAPPFVDSFSPNENNKILNKINSFKPDVILVGMTAPKQEIWSYKNYNFIKKCLIVNVGAVLDYLSLNKQKQNNLILYSRVGIEWLYRFIISPKRIWIRIFISFPKFIFILFLKYLNEYYFIKIKIVKNYKKFLNKKSYCLVAFNLAAFAFLKYNYLNKFYFWPDGIFFKVFDLKTSKLPGYLLVDKIKYIKNLKKIIVFGNLSKKSRIFLSNNFSCQIINIKLPYGNISKIIKHFKKIKKINHKNSVFLLTLPTPKQEILAQEIYKNYKAKIICIGGGVAIAAEDEKRCPRIILNIGMEFAWRLQYETKRRLIRILLSIYKTLIKILNFQIFRIRFFYKY